MGGRNGGNDARRDDEDAEVELVKCLLDEWMDQKDP